MQKNQRKVYRLDKNLTKEKVCPNIKQQQQHGIVSNGGIYNRES